MSVARFLNATALVGTAMSLAQDASAKPLTGEKCVFESKSAIYAGGPPEPITLVWNRSTGEIVSWSWDHGGVPWFSFPANRGTAELESGSSYYYRVDIGMTTSGYETTRYSLKGYITVNIAWPDATFAAVYEGTGTAWMGAQGTVNCS